MWDRLNSVAGQTNKYWLIGQDKLNGETEPRSSVANFKILCKEQSYLRSE